MQLPIEIGDGDIMKLDTRARDICSDSVDSAEGSCISSVCQRGIRIMVDSDT